MDLIEDIGPILGIVAFLGFAILALLIVLQAREVRRLREWAGRAPERAVEADDAALVTEGASEEEAKDKPSRLRRARARIVGAVAPRWDELDRRSPIDPRWFVALVVAGAVAAGVVTSGFGLAGGDEDPTTGKTRTDKSEKVEVAVLNATEMVGVADPVSGIADLVANEIVKPAGFTAGVRTDAPAGEEDSVIMFEPEAEADAEAFGKAVADDLGETELVPMTESAREQAKGAPLALLIGFDDADFGADAAAEDAAAPPVTP